MKQQSEIDDLIERVNKSDISSIKEVIMQLITIINNPKSSAKDLKDVIERDPPLSAKLLKLANSAYYGFHRKISKIQEAIIGIGYNAVKELAFNQKVCELFQKKDHFEGYSRNELWKHSVAVAICNKAIFMKEFREFGENVYTSGLLLNIGIIIEDQFLQNKFTKALAQSKEEKRNLWEVEKRLLKYDHSDIGRALTNSWGFPEELVIAIGNHHNPDSVDEEFRKITMTSYISDYICQRKEIGYSDAPYEDESLYLKCLKELNIQEKAMDLIIDDVQKEILNMKNNGWYQNE